MSRKKPSASSKPSSAEDPLAALASRIAALESALQPGRKTASPDIDPGKYWVLDRLNQSTAKGGEVVYAGSITTPTGEQYLWQRHAAAGKLFQQDWTALTDVLAALGHPIRLRLLQCLLSGQTTKAELERIEGLGTTGQLYHHLKTLQDAGWVRSLERGTYGVPGERVVPLLAMLTAASG